MPPFASLFEPRRRRVAGLMTGTSLDGVDVVIADLAGSGPALHAEVLAFQSRPYPEALRALLLANSAPATSSVRDLSQLNVRLAHIYAEAVRGAAEEAGMTVADLDLVGSHGQTVHHVPVAADCAGQPTTSTLQIGDPSVLANLLGVPVVGDFRVADMALGGQGAPLVPYFDYVTFTDSEETRGLLNLGGIANITVLPAGASPDAVFAFDTGPSNLLIDALAQRDFGQPYDAGGAIARRGEVLADLLDRLLADPYLAEAPPKSTGREYYGQAYVDQILAWSAAADPADRLATVTAFTAHSIHDAYQRFIAPKHRLDTLIASGGGKHNAALMGHLQRLFAPVPVRTADAYGVDSDAKEALCFAVLAHEYVNGVPTNLPSVTGASRPALLGKLCLPLPR